MVDSVRFEDAELHASLEIFLERLIEDLYTHLPKEVIPQKELLVKSEDGNLKSEYEPDYKELMTSHAEVWSDYSEYSHCVEAFLGSSVYTEDALFSVPNGANNRVHLRRVVVPNLLADYFNRKESIEFDDELFAEVYEGFEDYLQADSIKFRSWALLSGFEMEIDELDLDDSLTVRRVSPQERSVVDDSISRGDLSRFDVMDDFLIEAEFEKSKDPDRPVDWEDGQEMFNAVMMAFRMFDQGGDVKYKSVFTEEMPVSYSAVSGLQSSSPMDIVGGLMKERCSLGEESADEFKRFWREYKSYFYLNERNSITNPLRRFNQMDQKSILEDALIDSVIAFESTLLQEIGQTESYRFRMPLRASLLLDDGTEYSRDFIYNFFRELYDERSAIVHRGKQISDTEIEGENMSPSEFVKQAREFLRITLLQYIQYLEQDQSMQQTNKEMDKALRSTEYPVE
jgi:hypothetical protein